MIDADRCGMADDRLGMQRHPEAAGYLRDPQGYRLFDRRDALLATLRERVRAEAERIRLERGL